MNQASEPKTCRILSLDGGGAKGFYTIGVLKQLEALLGSKPLSEEFDFIYGTSTGAIIASLLALGKSVDEVHALYRTHVPQIMGLGSSSGRTQALEKLAVDVYGNQKFDVVKTGVGIVTAHWHEERPMIFKNKAAQAHGRHSTFQAGFGCTIADAVVASCSAYPFFNRKIVKTGDGSEIELLDGGYCANNPTLYAIADALMALNFQREQLRVVSIGVGVYPEPPKYWHKWVISKFFLVRLLQKTLNINTRSMEKLSTILFKDVSMVRINDHYSSPDMATDMLEHDVKKLNTLYQRGGESFGKHEDELKALLV